MNEKVRNFFIGRDANLANATRYKDGMERLEYNMNFVNGLFDEGDVVLDLCCGTGDMTKELSKRASLVYAVDFNQSFLDKIPELANVIKVHSTAENFMRRNDVFDLITLFGAIHYSTGDDVKNIYENCYKMLRPGGKLVVSGQWGINERVVIDKYSEDLQTDFFAEYRTLTEETGLLTQIGFNVKTEEILPDKFNHYSDTRFCAIVAFKPSTVSDPLAPKYSKSVGILGGMGSYATLDFFHRLLKHFPAEKEWDRPRILIDNRCTMPSRVRAILYDENSDILMNSLADSTLHLLSAGADVLVMVCNTAHFFLEEIEETVPESKGKFINIIDSLAKNLAVKDEQGNTIQYLLLASEGTIESKIYNKYLSPYGVSLQTPSQNEYKKLRRIIEDVKQDMISDTTAEELISLIEMNPCKDIIIGCTELPPVCRKIRAYLDREGYRIYDPLESAINELAKKVL